MPDSDSVQPDIDTVGYSISLGSFGTTQLKRQWLIWYGTRNKASVGTGCVGEGNTDTYSLSQNSRPVSNGFRLLLNELDFLAKHAQVHAWAPLVKMSKLQNL